MQLTDESTSSCYSPNQSFSKETPMRKCTLGRLFIAVMITVELSVNKC